MGRSRYKIYEPTHSHFLTCTVLHWIPLFTNKESVNILIESFKFLQKNDNFKLYAYVILENHIHIVAQSDDIAKSMARFKRHTARALLKLEVDSCYSRMWATTGGLPLRFEGYYQLTPYNIII